MTREERLRRLGGGLVLTAVVAVAYGLAPPDPEQLPLRYDPDGGSNDLEGDLKLMWESAPDGFGPHAVEPRSTDRALDAASRVFNTVDLRGKARDEVTRLLGDPYTPGRGPPAFPVPMPPGLLVYRFHSGTRGWVFRVRFEGHGRVEAVDRYRAE